ncbi:3-deoxy-manno-octulosonate cytidylyltransferase [uncultured Gimesia sp.]|uniref:3-deoxy-manno-octulosonate cytidylyltransferase n=1 Tax=uncultured Gimesia sp. TaxID=1678688 RepID=UPI0030DD238E
MQVCGVIPARLQSSRLPKKLLLNETGKSLIQHTWEAAASSEKLDRLIVATDSLEIMETVHGFGGKAVLTGEHPSGTDRIAEVAIKELFDAEILVNIQGDEPEISPQFIDQLIELLIQSPQAEMATLATPIRNLEQLQDSSCTKVVCRTDGSAMYFSRLPIPYTRDIEPESLLPDQSPWLLHLGIYAYRRPFLLDLTKIPPTPMEQLEKLEQLRALETGATIQVAQVAHPSVGIDTPEDYAQFVTRYNQENL